MQSPPQQGKLHYPTALALPPDDDGASRVTEQTREGVRIDRRAFRPLRKKNAAASTSTASISTADTSLKIDGVGSTCVESTGIPSLSFLGADQYLHNDGRNDGRSSLLMEYDGGRRPGASYEDEFSYLDGDGYLDGDRYCSNQLYNEDGLQFERGHSDLDLYTDGMYPDDMYGNAAFSASSPPRSGYPLAGDRSGSSWGSQMRSQSFGAQRRSPIPKQDRVRRGAQMRQAWSRDRFLRNTNGRKFDLRGCGSAGSLFQRPMTAPHIPRYVPPHQKRRDGLRMEVRQQMWEVAY